LSVILAVSLAVAYHLRIGNFDSSTTLDGNGRSSDGECDEKSKGNARAVLSYGWSINRALIAPIILIIHQPIHLSKLQSLYLQS
jgi:choline-glycine betaine transporter